MKVYIVLDGHWEEGIVKVFKKEKDANKFCMNFNSKNNSLETNMHYYYEEFEVIGKYIERLEEE